VYPRQSNVKNMESKIDSILDSIKNLAGAVHSSHQEMAQLQQEVEISNKRCVDLATQMNSLASQVQSSSAHADLQMKDLQQQIDNLHGRLCHCESTPTPIGGGGMDLDSQPSVAQQRISAIEDQLSKITKSPTPLKPSSETRISAMERAHRIVIVGFPRKMMQATLRTAAGLFLQAGVPQGRPQPVVRAFDMTKKVTLDFADSTKASDFLTNIAAAQPIHFPDPVFPGQSIELRAKRDMEPGTRLLLLAMGKIRGLLAAAMRPLQKEMGSNGLGGDIYVLRAPEGPVILFHVSIDSSGVKPAVALQYEPEQFAEFHASVTPLLDQIKVPLSVEAASQVSKPLLVTHVTSSTQSSSLFFVHKSVMVKLLISMSCSVSFEDTRREVREGTIVHTARLDRAYCKLPPALLADLTVRGETLGRLQSNMASDHIPVVVTLSTFKPQEAPKKLPKWLVRHPLFRDILDPAISALYALDLNPWDRLGRIKNLMFEVAEEVRSQLASQPAETTEAKHFRTLQVDASLWPELSRFIKPLSVPANATFNELQSIVLFKAYCVSLLYFMSQVHAPSISLIKTYQACVRLLTAGPNNALSYDMCCNLTQLGLPIEFPHITLVTASSRARYIARCDEFPRLRQLYDSTFSDDDWCIVRRIAGWNTTSFAAKLFSFKDWVDQKNLEIRFERKERRNALRGEDTGMEVDKPPTGLDDVDSLADVLGAFAADVRDPNERGARLQAQRTKGKRGAALEPIASLGGWSLGWQAEMQSARRIPESGDKKRNNPEYTVAMIEDGCELLVATWGDGFRWEEGAAPKNEGARRAAKVELQGSQTLPYSQDVRPRKSRAGRKKELEETLRRLGQEESELSECRDECLKEEGAPDSGFEHRLDAASVEAELSDAPMAGSESFSTPEKIDVVKSICKESEKCAALDTDFNELSVIGAIGDFFKSETVAQLLTMKGFGRSSLNNEKAFQSDGAPADAGGEGNFEPIPFEQLSKKDQLEQEFWKKMAAQGELNKKGKTYTEYQAFKGDDLGAANYRQQWAKLEAGNFQRTKCHRKCLTKTRYTHGVYAPIGRIAHKEGGGEAVWLQASKYMIKAIQRGPPWVACDDATDAICIVATRAAHAARELGIDVNLHEAAGTREETGTRKETGTGRETGAEIGTAGRGAGTRRGTGTGKGTGKETGTGNEETGKKAEKTGIDLLIQNSRKRLNKYSSVNSTASSLMASAGKDPTWIWMNADADGKALLDTGNDMRRQAAKCAAIAAIKNAGEDSDEAAPRASKKGKKKQPQFQVGAQGAAAAPRGRTDSVLGLWCTNLLSRQRHLISNLRGSDSCGCGCKGWCSMYPHLLASQWMFAAMQDGNRPQEKHDGSEWCQLCPIGQKARASARLSFTAALIYIKGDWSEHAKSLGLSPWSISWSPCQFCTLSKHELHSLYHQLPYGIDWQLKNTESYEEACARCEIQVTLRTEDDRKALVQALRFRKPGKNGPIGGRLVVTGFVLDNVPLRAGDRLEPSPCLLDTHKLEHRNYTHLPVTITLWRTRRVGNEGVDSMSHRCPMFDIIIGTSPRDSPAVDELPCLYFGPIMRYVSASMWRIVLSNRWGFIGGVDQLSDMGARQVSAELCRWQEANNVPMDQRLSGITPKMLGKRKGCCAPVHVVGVEWARLTAVELAGKHGDISVGQPQFLMEACVREFERRSFIPRDVAFVEMFVGRGLTATHVVEMGARAHAFELSDGVEQDGCSTARGRSYMVNVAPMRNLRIVCEQPLASDLYDLPCFKAAIAVSTLRRCATWMGGLGGSTMKPDEMFSNLEGAEFASMQKTYKGARARIGKPKSKSTLAFQTKRHTPSKRTGWKSGTWVAGRKKHMKRSAHYPVAFTRAYAVLVVKGRSRERRQVEGEEAGELLEGEEARQVEGEEAGELLEGEEGFEWGASSFRKEVARDLEARMRDGDEKARQRRTSTLSIDSSVDGLTTGVLRARQLDGRPLQRYNWDMFAATWIWQLVNPRQAPDRHLINLAPQTASKRGEVPGQPFQLLTASAVSAVPRPGAGLHYVAERGAQLQADAEAPWLSLHGASPDNSAASAARADARETEAQEPRQQAALPATPLKALTTRTERRNEVIDYDGEVGVDEAAPAASPPPGDAAEGPGDPESSSFPPSLDTAGDATGGSPSNDPPRAVRRVFDDLVDPVDGGRMHRELMGNVQLDRSQGGTKRAEDEVEVGTEPPLCEALGSEEWGR
ncbi:unnamed protein product, partial [Prorocentrum cordatum]